MCCEPIKELGEMERGLGMFVQEAEAPLPVALMVLKWIPIFLKVMA